MSSRLRTRNVLALVSGILVFGGVLTVDRASSLAEEDELGPAGTLQPASEQLAPQAHVKVVSAGAFNPISTADVEKTMFPNTYCASATGVDPSFDFWQLIAPIELPVGAVITGFNADIRDNDPGADLTMTLLWIDMFSVSALASLTSSGTPGPTNVVGSLIGSPYTVNATEGLAVLFSSQTATATATAICNARVTYEIPSNHDNLVFTALAAPCRLFDTIPATTAPWDGPIGPGDGAITFEIAKPSTGQTTNQGGDTACAKDAVPTDALAVSINLIARAPQEQGHIRTAATGSVTQPVVNYSLASGMNNSSEVTVALNQGEIDIKIGGMAVLADSVDVRGVVLGYYTAMPNVSD